MTNKTEEVNLEEVNLEEATAEKKAEQEAQLRVSNRIQEVLEEEGYALQPFMQYSEFGVGPRVRLVKVPNENNNDEAGDTEEVGTDSVEDGATKS